MPTEPPRRRSVTARALALLGAFDSEHPRLTLTQLARRADLPLATVHRLAGELVAWGALERDDRGRYGVGFRVWETGVLAIVHTRLREAALPWLLRLHAETQETIQLAALDGFDAIYVEKLTASPVVPTASRIGARMPLHATGVGKALLASQGPAFVDALLQQPLRRHTADTITGRTALRRELAAIRQQGFATSWQEFRVGSCSVAAVVPADNEAQPAAAVGIVSYRLRRDLTDHVGLLREATAAIAARLRSTGDDPFPSLEGEAGV